MVKHHKSLSGTASKHNHPAMAERNNIKEKSYYYWQRKFRKESYDQMQLLAVTEEPAEISFVEFAAPTSKKAASTQDSLNSTTTAVIRHGAITLEISNDISEAVLSLLLGGNPCWRTLLKSLVSYLHVGYPHDFFIIIFFMEH